MEWDVLLGMIYKRTLTDKGIEFKGLIYNSPDLAPMRKKSDNTEKTIKVDPTDISSLYVFDDTTRNYVCVPCNDQQYTKGLSLWQHEIIRDFARKQAKESVDIVGLALAKEKIMQFVSEIWSSKDNKHGMMKAAKFLAIGTQEFKSFYSHDNQNGNGEPSEHKEEGCVIGGLPGISNRVVNVDTDIRFEKDNALKIKAESVCKRDMTEKDTSDNNSLDLTGWDTDYNLPD